jgi:hypothetical protein
MKPLVWNMLFIIAFGQAISGCDLIRDQSEQSPLSAQRTEQKGRNNLDITPQIAKAMMFQEAGKGIGHFTFKDAPDIHFKVPRKFLDFDSGIPDGEVDILLFVFYLPDWVARGDIPSELSLKEQKLRYINATIESVPARYALGCWVGRCQGQGYAAFQGEIQTYQYRQEEDAHHWAEAQRCLEHGRFDSEFGLTAYEGKIKDVSGQGPDVIYLTKGANPCNPGKWISCSGYSCSARWVKEGIRYRYRFSRELLHQHESIDAGFVRTINNFIIQ